MKRIIIHTSFVAPPEKRGAPSSGTKHTGKKMKFAPAAATETSREKLGDENGGTDMEEMSSSLEEEEEEENPKKQYTLTERGTRLVVCTDGSAFHKDMPLVAAARSVGYRFLLENQKQTLISL